MSKTTKYVINVQKMARDVGAKLDEKPTEQNLCKFLKVTQATLSRMKKEEFAVIGRLMKYSEITGNPITDVIEKIEDNG